MARLRRIYDVEESEKVQSYVNWIMSSMLRLMEIGTAFALEQTITQLENLGYGDREILKFLSKHDEDVSDWVDHLLEANRGHNRYRQLDQVMNLIELGAKWPSLVTVLNKHKNVVMRHMLSQFNKSGDDIEWIIDNMDGWCKKLRKVGISWPELSIIEKSVDREKSRLANRDVFEQSATGGIVDHCIEVLADSLDHVSKVDYTNISPMNMLARLSKLINDGSATADDVVSGLNSIKDSILRYLLLQIKKGKVVTYNVDIPLYIRELRDIGVNWPELAIIEKSLSLGK